MSETVNFKLNGKDVAVPKGWTVMQAAKEVGEHIPHFCWHPGLSIAGVCRFCMVKVEGRPKLEIACNLQATEGMVVSTQSDDVKEAHKWALEFHLVNHPLDCPVCDQAGECGLQDYYMEVGQYKSEMTRPKVLKPKTVDVGSELVLDTERCILCSRCVRFEEEVTKTDALGIFDRGDRAIIGTYGENKIEHNYQENLVDICPVGAFTSKKFRFKQRVWFLKEKKAICPGCSTGCAIEVHAKPEMRRYYRIKPRFDEEANGHWICDKGRTVFNDLNLEARMNAPFVVDEAGKKVKASSEQAVDKLVDAFKKYPSQDWALLVSAQQTNEEYEKFLSFFVGKLGIKKVYQWREPTENRESFDGILYRGDHNPNTAGLMAALKKYGIEATLKDQFEECLMGGSKAVIAIAPEILGGFPSFRDHLGKLGEIEFTSVWSLSYHPGDLETINHALPLTGFAEKIGTYTNYAGKMRVLDDPFPSAVSSAKDVAQWVEEISRALAY